MEHTHNRNLTVLTFIALFKSHSVLNLIKTPQDSNCEPDEDHNICDEVFGEKFREEQGSDEESVISSVSEELSHLSEDTTVEDCSVVYFEGYLVKKLLEK